MTTHVSAGRNDSDVLGEHVPVEIDTVTFLVGADTATRDQAEQTLLTQFEQLSTIFDSLNAIVYVADMETHELLFLNAYSRQLFGEAGLGKPCYRILQSGQSAACPFCTNAKLVRDGEPLPPYVWEFQNTVTGKWFQCIDRAIHWTDGRLVRMEIAVDISERKRIEEQLNASNQMLSTLIRASPLAICAMDENRRMTLWSPAAERLFGWTEQEVIGQPNPLVSADKQEEFRAIQEQLWCNELVADFETQRQKKDGSLLDVSVSSALLRDQGGDVAGAMAILADISERRRAEELRRRLTAMVEATTDFVATADAAGRINYCNRAARAMLGIDAVEDIGHLAIVDIQPQWARAIVTNEALPATMRDGTWSGETALLHRDGREIPVSQTFIAHRAADGAVEFLSIVARDISERRHAEQLREHYIHTVSHDLRNPLAVIDSRARALQMLLKADADSREQQSVQAIMTSTRRMSTMIRDLVDSARVDSGHMQLAKRPIDLPSFVSDLLRRTTGVLEVERVIVEDAFGVAPAHADPDRLERILINLLSNALKYSAAGSPVRVRIVKRSEEFIVSVTDCGAGIDDRDLPHIFERFYRAQGGRTSDGVGLGLYITKMQVEAHGGCIWVESERGVGTTFYFSLPAG